MKVYLHGNQMADCKWLTMNHGMLYLRGKEINDMAYTTNTYGNPEADILLIQTADDHDMELIEKEISYIREYTGGRDFCLITVKVDDWNKDLSPWPAPAVFGNEDFGEGAPETLDFLLKKVLLPCDPDTARRRRIYLGGYSLAGLFALWAGCRTDAFDGIAAASPSIWFPGFAEYMRNNVPQTKAVYLSLGDREEKTRHPLMSQVGNVIRSSYEFLKDNGIDCVLEWNKGNHFKNPDMRTAKAFAWLMNRDQD